MRRLSATILSGLLLVSMMMPMTVLANEVPAETASVSGDLWDNEFSRIMDKSETLSKAEIRSLGEVNEELLRDHHVDVAVAIIPESRLEGQTMEEFCEGLYESCSFGYGDSKDGFMFLYLEDTRVLKVVPMGGAVGVFTQRYLDFLEERIPTFREDHGLYGICYGCLGMIRSGLEGEAAKEGKLAAGASGEAAEAQNAEAETAAEEAGESEMAVDEASDPGDYVEFARVGEGADRPRWFPKNLEEAHVYYDAEAPRVVDYADIFSEAGEASMSARIAEISAETGKDIVVVTDVSNYGLGEDIYAADFYDYNGYGYGEEHDGIILFLNMDPEERGGWTAETGTATRSLFTQAVAERLDDFLYETLATGEYEQAVAEWIEDVYSVFTTGIARAPFWYPANGEAPEGYRNPDAPVVVDEWGLLDEEQIRTLEERHQYLKETYGINVYFHTTGDELDLYEDDYDQLYMRAMGYEEDAVLFAVENSLGHTEKYMHVHLYGDAVERIPVKFRSRIENNASSGDDGYGRLFEGQRLLNVYLEKGRVPRNGFYWGMITILSLVVGALFGGTATSRAASSMITVQKNVTAYSYLDEKRSVVRTLAERFLYKTTRREYVEPPKISSGSGSSTRSSSSSSHSTYKSSYSGHSGTSHTGHGRKF